MMKTKTLALLLTGILVLANIQPAFANSISKLEYTKQLVKGLGFEVESAEKAYKRETSESEDIIYTAFQMGLLKGVSWDFKNPMTEEEREVILANAMAIHEKNEDAKDETDLNDEIDSNEANQKDEVLDKNKSNNETTDKNYSTQYGEIKKPTNMNPNEDIWTDEAFNDFLVAKTREEEQRVLSIWGTWHARPIGGEEPYLEPVYYDESTMRFFIWDYADGSYIKTDKNTFETLKAVFYHADQVGSLKISLNHNTKALHVAMENGERTTKGEFGKVQLFIPYNKKSFETAFVYTDGYIENETKLDHIWNFPNLFDDMVFEENGVPLFGSTYEERLEVMVKIHHTEQYYTDLIYNLCDALYGDDAENVYLELMTRYLETSERTAVNDDYSEFYYTKNLSQHTVYTTHPPASSVYMGVESH